MELVGNMAFQGSINNACFIGWQKVDIAGRASLIQEAHLALDVESKSLMEDKDLS